MSKEPVIIERTFDSPVERVWKAISDRDEMKDWYFDLKEFKPEPGFQFTFSAGAKEKQYLHVCTVMEVITNKKLSYSWKYDGYDGNSIVTFELFDENGKTRLKLTHEGLETFPDHPDLARENFVKGWTAIIGTSLVKYLNSYGEKK